jgi:hypothetical protein
MRVISIDETVEALKGLCVTSVFASDADEDISDQWETTSDEADAGLEEEISPHAVLERNGGLSSIAVPSDCLGSPSQTPPSHPPQIHPTRTPGRELGRI